MTRISLCINSLIYLLIITGAYIFPELGLDTVYLAILAFLLLSRIIVDAKEDSLSVSLSIVTVFLFALPMISVARIEEVNVLNFVFIFIVAVDLLKMKVDKSWPAVYAPIKIKAKRLYLLAWIFCLAWASFSGIFISLGELTGLVTFGGPFTVSLVIFERLLRGGCRKLGVVLMLFAYVVVMIFYTSLYWSGFGRIVVAGIMLMPILLAQSYTDIGFRKWQISALSPFLLYLAQISRHDNVEGFNQLAGGSSSHHLIISADILRRMETNNLKEVSGFSAFLDQFSLLFLNWFPRSLWSDKPVGLGMTSVDVLYGRQGFSEGYTHSVGFIGEQIYLLGYWFPLGLITTFIALLSLRYIFVRVSLRYFTPIIIFDISLISYFWGGSATFGSRLWFFIIPVLVVLLIITRIRFTARRFSSSIPPA